MTQSERRASGSHPAGPGVLEWALLCLLVGLAAVSVALFVWQALTAQPARVVGLTIDRLSTSLALLVSAVGAATFRFSQRYLHGEPEQRHFLRWLAATIVAAYTLMFSTNLVLLIAAWSLTSLGLHRLLTVYRDRPEAWRPARKKFLISRLGDLALAGAAILIWQGWGTLDLHVFLERIAQSADGARMTAVGVLIVIAALTKSAQFPFHSWLPETMEAPTPVSALMHAGVINAGGALLLRFAPLIVRVPEALLLLAFVGTLTVTIGMLAMWAQVKIKRTLAWSTVSQMGFMMVQCGLAVFPAALLHILGHGFYKAWSFLRSGEVAPPATAASQDAPLRTLALVGTGAAVSVPTMVVAAWATGFSPLHSYGELALSGIVALSAGQLWVAVLGPRPARRGAWTGCAIAALLTLTGTAVAFSLYRAAAIFLHPVLGDLPVPSGPLAQAAAVLPLAALILLTVLQALLPTLSRTAAGRALYVHALHGFYFGTIADRVVDACWACFSAHSKEVVRA